jgi:hypothetical protein
MKAGNINQAAWDLGLAADSLLVRGVTARWSGQGVDAAFRFAQQDNSLLIRNVTATWSPDVIGTARDLALSTGGLLSRTVGAVWGAITPNMIALALATDSDLTKTITGEVDLTGLTDEQLDFLNALTGSTGGMITLGGSFLWDPSTGFQTWLESTTFDNIADPLNALIAPMAALRGELTSLTSEIRIQNAADEAARAEAVRVKALAEATAAGEKLLADRGAAVSKLTSVVSQIDALDAAHSTNFINNKNQRVDIGVNADGTLTDNINPWLEYTSTTDLAAFRAKWSADGGLQDQLFAANDARAVIDRALAAARQQVINLGGVPTFAQGGNHSGGFRIVGESGPELEATGAARYYSARDTARMIGSGGDNRELVQEIRELRNEVKSLREQSDRLDTQILNQTKRNTRLQEQWEKTGMPPERATL